MNPVSMARSRSEPSENKALNPIKQLASGMLGET
jgi:hypothetical protein